KIAASQLKQVLDAYSNRGVDAAVSVWFHDDHVDAHYNSLLRELVPYMMDADRTVTPSAHLLFIAKKIVRIDEHSTHVTDESHYLVTGEEIATERPRADAEAAE